MQKLSTIASNIQKQSRPISNTIVAVVTDITRPLYRQKQSNYIVMLKIIDETMNDQQVYGVMSKDCTVYLISKRKRDVDFVRAVGEIVLLDKFTFVFWDDIKLETKYLGITEGLYVVDIDQNQNKLIKRGMLTMNPQLLDVNMNILQRVKFLKQWRSTHLPKIYQPRLGVSILNSHCVMIQPFNMILRYEQKIHQEQISAEEKLSTLLLKDNNNNLFKIRSQYDQFQSGDLVMVRSIQTIGQSFQLILTQTGNILRFTFGINPEVMNYMGIHRDNQKFLTSKKQNGFTLIHSSISQVSYLSQLIQLQDHYNHSIKKQQVNTKDMYLVNVVVINYQGKLSMYHREFQILLHEEFFKELSEDQRKEYKESNKIGYIYEGVVGIIDRSNQSKGKPFYVHLFTSDPSGNFVNAQQFEKADKAINTPQQETERQRLLNSIHKRLDKISTQSSFLNYVTFALEPIRSEKLLFRVINTTIL